MYCARHGSPLLIGFGENYLMIGSEPSAFCGNVTNYVCLNNNDITVLRRRDRKVTMQNVKNYKLLELSADEIELSPAPYKHWTIKEIHEQYEASIRAINFGGRLQENGKVMLGGPTKHMDKLKEIKHLILLGCGTSKYAADHAMTYFYDLCDFDTIQCFSGPRFKKCHIPKDSKTAVIFLSQSGETRDLYKCIKPARDKDCFLIGVINVIDSQIAREMDCGCYLNAGREVGVASTKAFTSQIIILSLLAIFFAQIKDRHQKKREHYVKCLRQLPQNIRKTLEDTEEKAKEVASYLKMKQEKDKENDVYMLGSDWMEPVAQEGALKNKEIGYIHAEGYEGNALRHGPYALLVEGTPVIFLIPDDDKFALMNSTIEEVASRKAYTICVSDADKVSPHAKIVIKVPKNDIFRGVLHNIPMQLVAYHLGISKGIQVDRPKNLAKCISI
jgi:glucosamine--fructose-6-phosphate aminotransferase (isomerizing)